MGEGARCVAAKETKRSTFEYIKIESEDEVIV